MAYISLPDGASGIRALFAFRPESAGPIAELANTLLHARNSLTLGERELIAAYVSSLNDCTYCLDSHAAIASWHFGNDELFVRSVVTDPSTAVIPDKLKALLDSKGRSPEEIQRFILAYLLLHLALKHQPGLTHILDELHFPVTSTTLPEFGELPVTRIGIAVGTERPADDVVIESAELTGMDAFEEVVNVEDISRLRSLFPHRLLQIVSSQG